MKIPDIRKLRHKLDWTQVELAKRSGVTQSCISRIEEPGGIDRISVRTLRRIVRILERGLKRAAVVAESGPSDELVPFESSHNPDAQSGA